MGSLLERFHSEIGKKNCPENNLVSEEVLKDHFRPAFRASQEARFLIHVSVVGFKRRSKIGSLTAVQLPVA